jgi:hypothetical protein
MEIGGGGELSSEMELGVEECGKEVVRVVLPVSSWVEDRAVVVRVALGGQEDERRRRKEVLIRAF